MEQQPSPIKSLSESIEDFWRAGPELGSLQVSPLAAEQPDALLRRLGPLGPEGAGGPDLGSLLAPLYSHLAAGAERRALG